MSFTFNHFNFNVSDLERSLAFYREALGLESAGLILQFFGMFVLAPLALGLGASVLMYTVYWKKRPPAEMAARPWKRQ